MDIDALKSKGFNTDKALELLGGSGEIYQKLLNTYYQNIDDRINDIKAAYNDNDLKKYTVFVHALKSTSRQIGADELGEMAYHLELCGKAENKEEIDAKTDELIKKYIEIGNIIEPFVTDKTVKKKADVVSKKISPSLVKAKLLKLKQSAKKFDMDSIRKTITEIENFEYNKEQKEILMLISDGAKAYKYDIVASSAENLLKMLYTGGQKN